MFHIFAMLDFDPQDISDMLSRASRGNTADFLLRTLVEHTAYHNGYDENGLVFAAQNSHRFIPDLMRVIPQYKDHAYLQQLVGITDRNMPEKTLPFLILCKKLVRKAHYSHPIFSAPFRRDIPKAVEAAKSLLRFEECTKDDGNTEKLCLWSQTDITFKPALFWFIDPDGPDSEDLLRELLNIHKPCDPDLQNHSSRETALHHAARKGSLWIVKLLVDECHASLSVRNWNYWTPLEAAREWVEAERHGVELGEWDGLEFPKIVSKAGGVASEIYQVIEYLEMAEARK